MIHYMEGAVEIKLLELDRFETLISSQVYLIELFPATSLNIMNFVSCRRLMML